MSGHVRTHLLGNLRTFSPLGKIAKKKKTCPGAPRDTADGAEASGSGRENREAHHQEVECRSVRHQTLLNSVLGETLRTSSAIPSTKRNWNVNGLLSRWRGTLTWEKTLTTTTTTTRNSSAVRCWSRERDKTVGTSTNCSTTCARRRSTKRCGIRFREILGTAMTCSTGICVSRSLNTSSSWFPVCVTGARRGSYRPCAPRRAAASPPVAPADHPDRVDGNRPGREVLPDFAVHFNSYLHPGPCHLRALCAVVLRLGKGHCHCHPLMAKK